jgi:hypothetical protein
MSGISRLFGESPFVTLTEHGRTVNECVRLLGRLFEAALAGDVAGAREVADEVERLETAADALQTSLQEQLAVKALVPVDKQVLSHTAEQQDAMADRAEDIAVTATCRPLSLPPALDTAFQEYLAKVIECCDLVAGIMNRMDLLVESSFRGRDALTVSKLITEVDEREDQIKAIQTVLTRRFFGPDVDLPECVLLFWWHILGELGRLARAADQTAGGIRLMLKGQ